MEDPIKALSTEIRQVEIEIKVAAGESVKATDEPTKAYWREKELKLRKKEEQLRKKEEQLRKKEEQLRKKEEQLREEKLIALRAGAVAVGPGQGSAPVPDLEATAMMKELHSTEVPAPGAMLSLGVPFLFHLDYKTLFVRECYPRLSERVAAADTLQHKYIITGTPGIGKSCFFYYLLARLLHTEQPPPFIVWQRLDPVKAWCYNHGTGEVRIGDISSFLTELRNSKSWYIADGVPPQLQLSAARTLQISSPQQGTFKEMNKAVAKKLYVPLWSLKELLQCRREMYTTVDEALAKQLYEYYGGVPRYVLERPRFNPEESYDELLHDLREALASCDTTQMQNAVGAVEMGPAVSHRVLHIVADDRFRLKELVFASKWAADKFIERALKQDLQGLVQLMNGTSGALKGMLYESIMHTRLPEGGTFTVAPFSLADLKRGEEAEYDLLSSRRTEIFKDVQTVAGDERMERVYCRPKSPTFPVLDSFQCVGGKVYLFQMTVSSSKTMDADKLEKALQHLHLEDDKMPYLFFVVPPDIYGDFKLKPSKSWPPSPQQGLAARTKLYVLKAKAVFGGLQMQPGEGPLAAPPAEKRKRVKTNLAPQLVDLMQTAKKGAAGSLPASLQLAATPPGEGGKKVGKSLRRKELKAHSDKRRLAVEEHFLPVSSSLADDVPREHSDNSADDRSARGRNKEVAREERHQAKRKREVEGGGGGGGGSGKKARKGGGGGGGGRGGKGGGKDRR